MVVARTSDLGQTHDASVVAKAKSGDTYTLPDGSKAIGLEQHKLPSIAVDPKNPNNVYASWRLTIRGPDQAPVPGWSLGGPNGIPSRTMLAVSNDGGTTWSQTLDVMKTYKAEDIRGSGAASLVTGSDGTVYGFTREDTARPQGSEPAQKARLFMLKSTDRGATWDVSVVSEGVQRSDDPQAAIARDGTLYMAYSARGANSTQNTPPNASEVYVMSSNDGGTTWSAPINVTDDDPGRRIDQYLPGISVSPSGRVDVAFFDFRNDPFFASGEVGNMNAAVDERYWDVYVTHSSNGGRTWAPNMRVTQAPVDNKVGISFNNRTSAAPWAWPRRTTPRTWRGPTREPRRPRTATPRTRTSPVSASRRRRPSARPAAAPLDGRGRSPAWGWGWPRAGSCCWLRVPVAVAPTHRPRDRRPRWPVRPDGLAHPMHGAAARRPVHHTYQPDISVMNAIRSGARRVVTRSPPTHRQRSRVPLQPDHSSPRSPASRENP
ncbi:MAG: sialidase family protein [Acidimicrobiales bacterium]